MTKHIPTRDDFHCSYPITTRWMDNDVFGHVNNVVYYSYFDTVINHFILEQGQFDIRGGEIGAYIVKSECNYYSSVAYPDQLEGAFRVNKVGNSSVEYGVAVFRQGQQLASAYGIMVHVFVDKESQKPTPIPSSLRQAFCDAILAE